MATCPAHLDPGTWNFYREVPRTLNDAHLDYLVGGAYAFERYTGIARHTKDFDVFARKRDVPAILERLGAMGCRTEMTFPHWLGKAFHPLTKDFIDVIFSSGSGVAVVDDEWFAHAVPAEVLGVQTRLSPAEEIIWSKAFILERERYDGNDVAHLLRARAADLDWKRLLRRFDGHWPVLFAQLVLFTFIYPDCRGTVPPEVTAELLRRFREDAERPPARDKVCRGTLLSRAQYLPDIQQWGYRDARLDPGVQMTPEDIAHWTHAIGTIE
jgi:hypothetical protein